MWQTFQMCMLTAMDQTVMIKNYVYSYSLYYVHFTHFSQGDYASVDAMQKKADSENIPDQMLYAELGAGGGRKGPKSEPMESNYAQVKVDEMGYPARGPASDMSEPPQYPTSINRDRSRRHSPPAHYGELDDDDGVIV